MRTFLRGVGMFIAYWLLILIGVAVIIGLGYGLGFIISVHDEGRNPTGSVCTSTLCE